MVLQSPYLARVSRPGQFCLLTVPDVVLRRPLSIYYAGKGQIEFLYKTIGKGTKTLAAMKKGETVRVLGPLGNGYPPLSQNTLPVLVAGGTGIASLSFLAASLSKPGILFFGARKKSEIIALDAFKKKKWRIQLATEDGSAGFKGYVTDLCKDELKGDCRAVAVYACGPHPMLAKIAHTCSWLNLTCFVSLEEMMACGVGNCQGCAIPVQGGYKMACKDGPVFNSRDILW